MSQIGESIRSLLLHKRSEVAAAGYRISRYTITDIQTVKLIRNFNIDISIIRTMTKDSKCQLERIQAFKLIRTFLDLPGGVDEISIGVIRALTALAEQSDDKLRHIAIETLAEIFVQRPSLISRGGGIRNLLQTVVEGPFELSQSIAMAFTYVTDLPQNRKVLRNGRDLEYLISAFTDYQSRGHVNSEKLQYNAVVITSLLKSWPGICVFSQNNFSCLKSLVNCFQYPVPAIRETLMEIFFSIFHVKSRSWSSSYLAGRRLTTLPQPELKTALGNILTTNSDTDLQSSDAKFRDHYTSLLLVLFMKCGLVKNLTLVLKDGSDSPDSRRAALLLVEILGLGSKILPQKQLTELVDMKELWTFSSELDSNSFILSTGIPSSNIPNFGLTGQIHSALVFQIDKISRNVQKTRNLRDISDINLDSSYLQIKKQIGVQIDDNGFKQLLQDTQVLATKSYSKWNWDALTELIQGPLLNPKRLDDAIRNTKFMKRLMSFYRPFKYRFSSIKNTRPNQKCIRVGQALLTTLLQSSYGVKYLTENKLLRQIAECLAQIDPMSGIVSSDPLFSSTRLENTLTSGYFNLLGTLSGDPNGMAMMERWRMFNMFYHISELRSREDLISSFIKSMNYELQGHPRIILSKALTTGQKNVRLAGTAHLKSLCKTKESTQKWAIRLLVTQLFDPEIEVCKLAVEVLEEFCRTPENLEYFVMLEPSLEHLGEIGNPLLLKFLSTSRGFQYLKEIDYVFTEMDNWFLGQNDVYVSQVEEYLEKTQRVWSIPGKNEKSGSNTNFNTPRHFYGELTLTEEGCQLLRAKGHFGTFCSYIQEYGDSTSDFEVITKLKGCLWAVGHAASNLLGVPFLEETRITEDIIRIFENSRVYSIKGTAFFVLGLISSTIEGVEILDELGWETAMISIDTPGGICIPKDIQTIFKSEKVALDDMVETAEEMVEEAFPIFHNDPVKRAIIKALSDLSNQILANEASKKLVQLSRKYGDRFKSVDLFLEAIGLLEKYRYRLPMRKFIFELFDTPYLLEKLSRRQKELLKKQRHSSGSGDFKKSINEPDSLLTGGPKTPI